MSWNQLSTDHFLNGMIFVCDASTYDDIFQHQIFGLPTSYIREMKNLVPYRSALFLLEKHTGLLKGVFIPTCRARKMIKDDLWNTNGECQFPSQIRFTLYCTMPSVPKESWHLPNFIRLSKVKAKFLDSLRVQMLLQAFQKYEMSNRMLIENSLNPASQYITTTILPSLSNPGNPGRQDPYYHPHSQQVAQHVHHPQQTAQNPYASTYRGMGPVPPPQYNRPQPQHPEDLRFQHDVNDELINSLKNEIDMLRLENALIKTQDRKAFNEDIYADYTSEVPPYPADRYSDSHAYHLDHKLDRMLEPEQVPHYV